MNPVITIACAVGLSQLGLSLLLLKRLGAPGTREWLFAALLVGTACHLLTPLLPDSLAALVSPWATAVPGLFWLFTSAVFSDHFRLTVGRWIPVLITVAFPIAGALSGRPAALEWLFFLIPQALEFVLLSLALWVVLQHWSTDLVESRRRLRVWFVGLIGVGVFVLILAREVLFQGQEWLGVWQYVFVAVLLTGINLMLLGYRSGALFDRAMGQVALTAPGIGRNPPEGESAPQAEPLVDRALVSRIETFMEEEKTWREMSLTLGQLAERVNVPQYRLRQAINVGLGYRNVSDFLNSYRIREAAGRLAEPGNDQLPVLTIAMDAGFRSLSSFNKAFKEAHKVTPTQYRKARSDEKC